MCLLPVVNLACTFRYDPNKYVQPESAASVCACVFFSRITQIHLECHVGGLFVFLQACLPLGQIAASSLCHVLVLYWTSTAHVSHVNSTTPCRQLPPTSANAGLTQLYVGGGTNGNLIVYNTKLILALLKGGWS